MKATIILDERPFAHRYADRDWEKTTIRRGYMNLFHALLAVHDSRTHDKDIITFHRDDGWTLSFDFSVNFVALLKEGDDLDNRLWQVNISTGEMEDLLLAFLDGRDDDVRQFNWDGGPPESR